MRVLVGAPRRKGGGRPGRRGRRRNIRRVRGRENVDYWIGQELGPERLIANDARRVLSLDGYGVSRQCERPCKQLAATDCWRETGVLHLQLLSMSSRVILCRYPRLDRSHPHVRNPPAAG